MELQNRELYRDQFLKHYGVLGMKWGVRRRSADGGKTSSKKGGSSSSSSSNRTQRRMSNKELTSRIKRLRLEKEYRDLTTVPKPATVSKIDKLVKNAGTVASLSTSAATIYKNLNALGVISKGGAPAGK